MSLSGRLPVYYPHFLSAAYGREQLVREALSVKGVGWVGVQGYTVGSG